MHEMLKEIMDENLRRIGRKLMEPATTRGGIVFGYTNWQGETRVRTATPVLLYYGTCEPYHKEEGWLMKAIDAETMQPRTFSVKDMTIEESRK